MSLFLQKCSVCRVLYFSPLRFFFLPSFLSFYPFSLVISIFFLIQSFVQRSSSSQVFVGKLYSCSSSSLSMFSSSPPLFSCFPFVCLPFSRQELKCERCSFSLFCLLCLKFKFPFFSFTAQGSGVKGLYSCPSSFFPSSQGCLWLLSFPSLLLLRRQEKY